MTRHPPCGDPANQGGPVVSHGVRFFRLNMGRNKGWIALHGESMEAGEWELMDGVGAHGSWSVGVV